MNTTTTTASIPCHALPTPSPPPETLKFYQGRDIQLPLTPEPEPEEYEILGKPVINNTKSIRPYVTRYLNVIQKLLKELDGRDKMMKIIQYFIKILLHYKLVNAKHWSTITSNFSMTRKLLRLGTALEPMRQLSTKNTVLQFILLSHAIVNNISDDIFCLHKLGVFGKNVGDRSETLSAYLWFSGIFIDLRDNFKSLVKLQQQSVSKDLSIEQRRQKIFVTEISIIKLLMDGIFCGKSSLLSI